MGPFIAPRGLIVEPITPLTNDGSIDGQGLKKLLARLIPFSQGLFLSSPCMGEGKTLSAEQRVELFEEALVTIRGRVPLLFWITRDTEKDTRETLLALREILRKSSYPGEVLWVDSPLFYHSNRGLPAYYQNLCSLVSEPLVLHNDPELIRGLTKPFKRQNIRTAILKELASLPSMVGLIFLGSLDRAYNYQRACRTSAHFRIYDGDELQFLDHPSMGGVVSRGANLAPKTWQEITEASLQLRGDQKYDPEYLSTTWQRGQYLRDLVDLYGQTPVALIKQVLWDLGIIQTCFCTRPADHMEEAKERIKEMLDRYGDL